MKSANLVLADVFEKINKKAATDFGLNPLYNVSLPGKSRQCGSKICGIEKQDFQDQEMFITKEDIIRGGIPNVMGDRYVKNDENTKIV